MSDREKIIDAMARARVWIVRPIYAAEGRKLSHYVVTDLSGARTHAVEYTQELRAQEACNRENAQAALAALLPLLREPTEAMVEAGVHAEDVDVDFRAQSAALWRAMWAEREKELMG